MEGEDLKLAYLLVWPTCFLAGWAGGFHVNAYQSWDQEQQHELERSLEKIFMICQRWGQRRGRAHGRCTGTELGVRLGHWIWKRGRGNISLLISLAGLVYGFLTCLCVYICGCICMWHGVFFYDSLPYLLRQCLSLNPVLTNFVKLVGQ